MATPVKDNAWLEWIAGLVGTASRQRLTATLPPHQFHCLLDELPLHLVPRRLLNRRDWQFGYAQNLSLNPQCSFLPAGAVPEELESRRDLLEGFCLQGTVAWVRGPALGMLYPFWLGPRLEEVVARLRVGETASSLPDGVREVLARAGILITEDHSARWVAEWSESAKIKAQSFQERNYVPLSGLIHPFHLAALRRYYRHAIRRGAIPLGDEQSPRRYVAHNEPVARYFHHQIAHAVSAIAGEPVKPSYVYLASYQGGAELKKHTDREQCEFSVTLCLDFSPEPENATSWPIRLDTPGGTVTVYQALGDALVYRGTKVPHYRSALAEEYASTSIFLHYVAADFSGPLD
ncbi:MAG: hypothetical protein WB919_11780 [Candidatus Sulfotelmatobacter sp.]